jgi:peptidyl-prolyl cis-trans isomerase SurA
LQLTKNKLDSVYQLIESGKLTFSEAALLYSNEDSKFSDGVAINPSSGSNVFSGEQIDKDLFFRLDRMRIGEIAPPAMYDKERNVKAFRIVKLDKRTKPHTANIDQDYDKIQEFALAQKKADEVGNWISEKTKKTYIIILDKELKQCNFMYKWE